MTSAEFARSLNDHVVSETKVPLETVVATYQKWQAQKQEKDNIDTFATDTYLNNVELPRAERTRLYDEYCIEKRRLLDTWRHSPSDRKVRALQDWIGLSVPPELLENGIEGDRIYTKNVIGIM